MKFDYYTVKIPRYLDANIFDCPIVYCIQKYKLEKHLPIPRSFRCGNCEYVVCMPSYIAPTFMTIVTNEEFAECVYMRTEDYDLKDLSDIYIVEIHERVQGHIITEYILTRSV